MEKNAFQIDRENDDRALVMMHGIRTRADVRREAARYNGAPDDVTSEAGRMADKLFCAAARHFVATVCAACGSLTIDNEISNMGSHHVPGPDICDACRETVDEAISALPNWVKDRDLATVLPALAWAFVKTSQEGC